MYIKGRKGSVKNKIFGKGLAFTIVVLFIGTGAVSAFNVIQVNKYKPTNPSNTLYVGGSGSGNYTKIQDAIDNANHDDTVFVYDDNSPYYEHVNINKMISLVGEDRNTTVIDGSYKGTVVIISADDVVLTGFTIEHGADAGIEVHSNDNQIFENIVKNNGENTGGAYGIYLSAYSNNIIRNNEITYNENGIKIEDWNENADNNLISENFIAHNLWCGMWDFDRGRGTIATWNVIADNAKYDIIHPAVIHSGIWKEDGGSIYHHNDFFFNTRNAYVAHGANAWDDRYVGNYWDDWESNPGFPYKYIIEYSDPLNYDNHPSATPFSDRPIVGLPKIDYYALVDEPIDFTANTSVDPNAVSWHWEFGDGTTSDEASPTHVFHSSGFYRISVTITDSKGRSDTSYSNARIGKAPNTPTITGPTKVKVGEKYNYTIVTTDPDGDDVYYTIFYVEWWGTSPFITEYTIGPYKSGEEAITEIVWNVRQRIELKIKAIDGAGLESDWAALDVTVPRLYSFNLPFTQFLERFQNVFPILKYLLKSQI